MPFTSLICTKCCYYPVSVPSTAALLWTGGSVEQVAKGCSIMWQSNLLEAGAGVIAVDLARMIEGGFCELSRGWAGKKRKYSLQQNTSPVEAVPLASGLHMAGHQQVLGFFMIDVALFGL